MACHVDIIPPKADKQQIDELIEVVTSTRGGHKTGIFAKTVGNAFMTQYPTVKEMVEKMRAKYKTFHYKVHGTTLIVVSPCPKGC